MDIDLTAVDEEPTGESSRSDLNDKRREQMRTVWEWVIVVVIALTAAMLIRMYVFQQYYIDGPSMQKTLEANDRVLVNKLSYRFHDIRRGDVIVFDRVTNEIVHDDLIKRVIACRMRRSQLNPASYLLTAESCKSRTWTRINF